MAVHAQSVIPIWINSFYPDFYVALTDQENFAYLSNSGADLTKWKTLFETLVDHIETWKADSRDLKDFMSALYSSYLLSVMYSEPFDPVASDGYAVLDMGGFIADTLANPVGHYDDLVETALSSGIWKSNKLGADTSGALTGTGSILAIDSYSTTEEANITAVQDASRASSSKIVSKALFEDVPLDNPPKTKQEMGEYLYNDLHYKHVVFAIPTQLTLPPYITPIT